MTHLPSQVLAAYFVLKAFGKWADQTNPPVPASTYRVSWDGMGDNFDLHVAVYTLGAKREDKRGHRTGVISEFPTLQVRVRALKDSQANAKLNELMADLDRLYGQLVTVEGRTYCIQNFSRQTFPAFLMEEERNKRRVWVFTGNLSIEEIS